MATESKPMIVQARPASKTRPDVEVPLVVDLDGTLIASDLLYESVAALLRQNFLFIFLLPLWLLKGKANLKHQIASRIFLNPAALPYRADVVEFLHGEKAADRHLVLATATNLALAQRIADHLQLFDEVIASDDVQNLKGAAKLQLLSQRFDHAGFDYIGDSSADVAIWGAARKAYLVQPSRKVLRRAEVVCQPAKVFQTPQTSLRAAIKLLRPHQWAKNLLLFVPLVLAHQLTNWAALGATALAFVAFSCCASAVYILNDLVDLQADRLHRSKRHRPIASGAVSIPTAAAIFVVLLGAGLLIPAIFHPTAFFLYVVLYLAVTTAYSFYLKRRPVMDVFVLAGLYTLRILAGGAAADVKVTGWLIAFSLFFFISLALIKRYIELSRMEGESSTLLDHRGYRIEDLGMIESIGPASGYMAVLTMCLYINAPDVYQNYSDPRLLWAICFILFYWITRVWFMARRKQLNDDPVVFAVTDPVSYLSGLAIVAVLYLASA